MEIDKVIEEANRIIAQDDPDLGDVSKLVQWLEKVSFYLSEDDCVVGNKLIEILDKAPYEVGEIRINYSPFKKHDEMNESYYL